jgi:hypothetical protein
MPWLRLVAAAAVSIASIADAGSITAAQNDLDEFMQQVVARRDDNWKKLQQYVLDEREDLELRGPGGAPMWGERREYTWFLRDGFFIRSPIKVNGVAISEADRRKYEDDYMRRVLRREQRSADPPPTDVDALIRQTRQPRFVSSAYFLRFRFDEGTYALVGREKFENRDVLRIEYYPTKLFSQSQGRRLAPRGEEHRGEGEEFTRLLNKVALITLWIQPDSHQIVRYTFDNVDLDFLPVPWLVRVDAVRAAMTMSQPFPDVWLPRTIEIGASLTVASGQFDFRETIDYHDYRKAEVSTKVGVPGAPRER